MKPVYAPDAQAREELSLQSRMERLSAVVPFAIGAAIPAYGLYKLGKLPDYIKGERIGTGIAIGAGAVMTMGISIGMALGGGNNNNPVAKALLAISEVAFGGGVGYLAARTLFGKSPSTSLIAGAVLGISLAIYANNHDAINKKAKQFLGLPSPQPAPDIYVGKPAVAVKPIPILAQ